MTSTVQETWPTYSAATVHPATRTVEVQGAWIGDTWVDDGVLAMARRSAEGGFGFRVRSAQVADAMVRSGLATRDAEGALQGRRMPAYAAPVRGWCASTHHPEPTRAVVEGRRGRSTDDPWAEDVRLCGRCADLLGEAGFFTAS
jgi:hypothetical protein